MAPQPRSITLEERCLKALSPRAASDVGALRQQGARGWATF